jgi:sugar lactone lactonase YvrE
VQQRPSGLGWLPDGDLLIVSIQSRQLLRRRPDGSLTVHADLSECAGYWINDMLVDESGRAYVGDIGFDALTGSSPEPTRLCRVDPDGRVSVAADGLLFPNGAVMSRDGKTLIVGESLGNRTPQPRSGARRLCDRPRGSHLGGGCGQSARLPCRPRRPDK